MKGVQMNWEILREISARRGEHHHAGHTYFTQHLMSRRQFARTATGTALAGAAGLGLFKPRSVAAASSDPLPIPGASPALGGDFHVFGPTPDGSFDPIDAEPATITDFNGFVGLAYINGLVTRTNTITKESKVLPMLNSDMRFMKGVYRGADNRIHQGAFALV
jgi:hypothetical protein